MGNKQKVVVTGGGGYIGSHTVVELIDQGYDVVVVDNHSNSNPIILQVLAEMTSTPIVSHNFDIADIGAMQSNADVFKDAVAVIHFAAHKSVGESVEQPTKYYHNNIAGLNNLLEMRKQPGHQWSLVFSSSCSVYGEVNDLPVTEKTPLNKCASPYAYTKQVGEVMLQDFVRATHDAKCIALRYFNPVGGHSSGKIGELPGGEINNLVPIITKVAIGELPELTVFGDDYDTRDGSCIRDYIHVSDIARAHVDSINFTTKMNSGGYDVINLGSGNGVSVLEAISAFERVTGAKVAFKIGPRRPGDVPAVYSDSSKAKALLGWEPKFDLDSMMSSAWEWQKNCVQNGLGLKL